jgi:Mg2+/Co2+ transporter CorB
MGTALLVAATLIGLLILLNAFFSVAETSLTAASRARMAQLSKEGDRRATRVLELLDERDRMIGAVLLGSNVATIAASAIASSVFDDMLGAQWGPLVATLVLTPLLLVFGEVLPKTAAIVAADPIARVVVLPVRWMVRAFSPVLAGVTWMVRRILRLGGLDVSDEIDPFAAREEIRGAVELHAAEGGVGTDERDILRGALDLRELTVGDVMIPHRAIRMIDGDLPARQILQELLRTNHTRLPVYRGTAQDIVGVLHARDLLREVEAHDGQLEKMRIDAILKEAWFVPETTVLQTQLDAFRARRQHFALVVDEYGVVKGLITLEDILEEIVGDIRDEHDAVVEGVKVGRDGAIYADGHVPIRDLNRMMDWSLSDEEAVTIAGFVLHHTGMVPDSGEVFDLDGFSFQIMRVHENAIKRVRIVPPQEEG